MKDEFSKKTDDYLSSSHKELGVLFAKVKVLNEMNEAFLPLVDAGLRPYCQVANLQGDKLVIITANGSVATQIRFQSMDLLRKFKPYPVLEKIRSIHCKVHPGFARQSASHAEKAGQTPELLSDETAEMIRKIADSIDDPGLRDAMKRIAERK